MSHVLITLLCLTATTVCSLLPFPFDLPNGGLVTVTLFNNAKQSFIQLQTLSPGKRLWNRRHFAVSQQTCRYRHGRNRNVLCLCARAAGQQRDEEQVQRHSCYL